jgi:hypothetical protein
MACVLTSGYTFLGCKGGAGGIKRVLITEFSNLTGGTFTATAGVVTAFTLGTGVYREYLLDKEMGLFSSAGTYTPASGTISYEPSVDFTIKKLTSAMIQEIHLVAQNTLSLIVEDINGDYWLFGYDRGMDLMTWSTDSGQAITDMNGHKLSFKGKEIEPIYKVNSGLIAPLL